MSTINSIPVVDLQQAEANGDFHVTTDEQSSPPDGAVLVVSIADDQTPVSPRAIPYPQTFRMSRTAAEAVAADCNRAYVAMHREGKLVTCWHVIVRGNANGFRVAKIPVHDFAPDDEFDFPFHMAEATGLMPIECRNTVRRFNETQLAIGGILQWALMAHPIRRPEPVDIAEVEEPEADATLSSIREALGEFATVTQLSTGELSVQFTLPERFTRLPKREGRQMISDVMDVFARAGFIASQAVRRLDALGTFGRVRPMESEMIVHPVSHIEKRFACFEFEDIDIVVRNHDDETAAAAVREFLRAATLQSAGVADAFEDDDEPATEAETLTLHVVGSSRNGETLTIAVPAGVEEMSIDGNRFIIRRHFGDLLHSPLPVEA